MILHSYDNVSHTRMTTLAFILSKLFPLIVSDAISCQLHNLNTLWYIILILHSYVEQVMMMCRRHKNGNLTFKLSELFPLDCFRCSFVSAP